MKGRKTELPRVRLVVAAKDDRGARTMRPRMHADTSRPRSAAESRPRPSVAAPGRTTADPDRGAKVLDIACGRGACLYPALDAVGPDGSVLGIDLAAGMVEQLNAELDRQGHPQRRGARRRCRGPRPARRLVRCGHRRVHDLLPARPAAGPPGAAPGAGAGRHPRPCRSSTGRPASRGGRRIRPTEQLARRIRVRARRERKSDQAAEPGERAGGGGWTPRRRRRRWCDGGGRAVEAEVEAGRWRVAEVGGGGGGGGAGGAVAAVAAEPCGGRRWRRRQARSRTFTTAEDAWIRAAETSEVVRRERDAHPGR